jgi:hypothetical protein
LLPLLDEFTGKCVSLHAFKKEENDENSDKTGFDLFCDADFGRIVGDAFHNALFLRGQRYDR